MQLPLQEPSSSPRSRGGLVSNGGERSMEATTTRNIEPGRVIGEAFETYRDHAAPLLGGALLVIGIAGVIEGLLSVSGSLILGILGAFGAGGRLPLYGLRREAGPGRP